MNTHTPLAEINEFHHLSLSHISREKSVKKYLLEDLPIHRPSSKRSIISLLHIPSLGHILELVCGQLGLLSCRYPYGIKYLVYLINKFLVVFINLRPIEGRRIHPSEVPKWGSHNRNLLMNPKCNLSICLGRRSLDLNCCDLCLSSHGLGHSSKNSPNLCLRHWWRVSQGFINISFSLSGGTCSSWGGAPTLETSSSSLRAAFLRVFMLPISTTRGLDAKSHHKCTLLARYKISKKERDS